MPLDLKFSSREKLKWMAWYAAALHLITLVCASFLFLGTEYEGATDWMKLFTAVVSIPHAFWTQLLWNKMELHLVLIQCASALVSLAFVFIAVSGKTKMAFVTLYFLLNITGFCCYAYLVHRYHG